MAEGEKQEPGKQLLHLVFGGELKDLQSAEFTDLDKLSGAAGKKALHDTVLERMECDDHKPPALAQQPLGGHQAAHQFVEFAIHE